jgi:hypothetical protein
MVSKLEEVFKYVTDAQMSCIPQDSRGLDKFFLLELKISKIIV